MFICICKSITTVYCTIRHYVLCNVRGLKKAIYIETVCICDITAISPDIDYFGNKQSVDKQRVNTMLPDFCLLACSEIALRFCPIFLRNN